LTAFIEKFLSTLCHICNGKMQARKTPEYGSCRSKWLCRFVGWSARALA
jgi:hypothetical protein